MSFNNEGLINKYGSWARVQVAFYDFIFQEGSKMCAECFKNKALEEISQGFAKGEDIYEKSIKAIEELYPTFEDAWKSFCKEA